MDPQQTGSSKRSESKMLGAEFSRTQRRSANEWVAAELKRSAVIRAFAQGFGGHFAKLPPTSFTVTGNSIFTLDE